MKLTIDAQVCSFAKPRGSTGSVRCFRDPVAVVVQEVSEASAPVAMRWHSKLEGLLYTRWYDGSHWFAFDRPRYAVVEARFSASDIVRMATDPRDHIMGYVYSGYFRKGDQSSPYLDRNKFVEFDDAIRQNTHDKVREWAADALVVGNTFYTRCPEPRYCASRNGPEVIIERAITGRGEPRRFDVPAVPFRSGLFYRADRFEQAVSASRDAWPSGNGDGERMEVLIGDSVTVDDDREALLDVSMDSLQETSKQDVLTLPPLVIAALSPLAACFWHKDREEVDADQVYDALAGFVDAATTTRYDIKSLAPNADCVIGAVLSRWSDRPITLSAINNIRSAWK